MKLTETEYADLKYYLGKSTLGILLPQDRMTLSSLIKIERPDADIRTPEIQNMVGKDIVGRIELEKREKIRSDISGLTT